MNIIQIGCHDGNDHVFDFISNNYDNISNCYLIEPLEEVFTLAKKKYEKFEKVKLFNLAIVDKEDLSEIEIFYPENISESQTTSIFKSHAEKHQNKVFSRFVKCCTVNKFLKDNKIDKVDRFYIDTEGLDCMILNSIDLVETKINYLEFEYVHSDGTNTFGELGKYTVNKLISLGYQILQSPPFNLIAIK
jgi:FkbM family methyltransferase